MTAMPPVWTTACPDWALRIVEKRSLLPCEPLFPHVADIAERIFKDLILVDVMGSPKMGDVTLDWVLGFVRVIFGAYDPVLKKRLIREFFLLISKKNTKSTIAAGIMLTALLLNSRNSAELIIIAPTKEVADNSFNPIRDFIREDEELRGMMNVSEHTKTVTHLGTHAVLKVVAADSDASAGKKASWILFDEVWIFGKRPKAASMFREAKGGLVSRPEGCVIYLSTMSDEQPQGVFKQLLDYSRDVRDGMKIDPTFLPLLFEFPKEYLENDLHLLPENFYITNPNLGASVDLDYLVTEFQKAVDAGETEKRDFLAKHLNVEIGMMLRANRWSGADFWQLAEYKDRLNIEKLIDLCDVIVGGLDGGGLDDLFGMALIGRDKKDSSIWYGWNRAWVHPIALERRKEIAPALEDFSRQGDLVIVEKIGDDVKQAGEILKKIYDAGKFPEKFAIGLDKEGMPSLQDGLLESGIPFELMIGIQQGWKLSTPTITLERKIAEGKFLHAGQPMMNWVVGNVRCKVSGNNLLVTKQESGKAKIDPFIASLNATALMSLNPEPASQSFGVYFL